MATLNHLQRKWLSMNVTWLMDRRHVPMSLLASKTMVETATLEQWLDYGQHGGITVSQDQLSRLAEALGIQARSNLYCYSPDEFTARYAGESAPTPAARKKPGPAKGSHREPRAAAEACPNVARTPVAGRGAGHGRDGKNGTDGTDGTDGAKVGLSGSDYGPRPVESSDPLGLSDEQLRRYLMELIQNPLVSFRNAIRLAYKALFVGVTLGVRAGGVNPPAPRETNP